MTNINNKVILKGIAASVGVAEGVVRIVKGSEDQAVFKEGDVLVTHITDPTMVAMMGMAAAIVCDIGGITSHPSILSRELGIPCVVNTGNATTILHSGQRIRVDGANGIVYGLD